MNEEVLDPADDDRALDLDMGELDGPETPQAPVTELPAEWEPSTDDEMSDDAN